MNVVNGTNPIYRRAMVLMRKRRPSTKKMVTVVVKYVVESVVFKVRVVKDVDT